MKIQCDVCESQPATVFCAADEAALCHTCDRRVHHANKLAGKHLRLSLLSPSPADPPLCDICQEKRAFVFCKEDRAILCRDCDSSIHSSSEHTQRHSRFILTGVKISSHGCGDATSPPGGSRSALSSSLTTSYHAPCSNNNNNNPYQMWSSDADQEGSISTTDYNVADCYTTSSSHVMPNAWHVDDLFYSSSAPDFFASKNNEYTLASGAQQADSRYGCQYY